MVLFHISPLLPLLTDYLNEIQQAQSKASSRAACPAPPTSPAPSMWGNKLLCLPVQPSQRSHPRHAPQAPLPFSRVQTHPGAGLAQVLVQTQEMLMGSKGMHGSRCTPASKPGEKVYHHHHGDVLAR